MTAITTTAPEINVAQKPAELQEASATQDSNTHEDGSKFDSVMKSEETALKDSETELQDSLQGEDIPESDELLIAQPNTFVIAAGTETPASPGVETPQTKNNPRIIELPATVSPGEKFDINASAKRPGHETNQSPEDTVVLNLPKNQENVISTSAEMEKLETAFKEMVGRVVKEITNFTPNSLEEAAGETLLKNQSDISLKNSDQPGRVSEIENTNPGNSSTITSGGQKSADKPFLEIVQRPSGFSEVLDKIVYVIKNNRAIDVSVLHKGNRLNINLTMDNGLLNVHINTNEAAMRELIENNMRDMVNNLEKDGVNISEFSVNLKDKRDNHNRENTFNHDVPVREFSPPAHIMSVNSGTGVVNIFV